MNELIVCYKCQAPNSDLKGMEKRIPVKKYPGIIQVVLQCNYCKHQEFLYYLSPNLLAMQARIDREKNKARKRARQKRYQTEFNRYQKRAKKIVERERGMHESIDKDRPVTITYKSR